MGCGFATVMGEQLEWHGSAALLSGYSRYLRSADRSVFVAAFMHAGKILTGGSWTWGNGISLLMEAWYDGFAYNEDQWSRLITTIEGQRGLQASAPEDAFYRNINWSSQVYQAGSLSQINTFLRLSYDGEKKDAVFDILWTPQGNGLIYRLLLDVKYNRLLQFFFTYRQLAGGGDSVLAQAPVGHAVILGLSLAAVF